MLITVIKVRLPGIGDGKFRCREMAGENKESRLKSLLLVGYWRVTGRVFMDGKQILCGRLE